MKDRPCLASTCGGPLAHLCHCSQDEEQICIPLRHSIAGSRDLSTEWQCSPRFLVSFTTDAEANPTPNDIKSLVSSLEAKPDKKNAKKLARLYRETRMHAQSECCAILLLTELQLTRRK
jgi:hypothetical protein